jgi:beta-glucanase (GH16 family)
MSTNGQYYSAWTPPFYIEVNMAFDPVSGSWPAIWLRGIDIILNPNVDFGELDIFEWQSTTPDLFLGTTHVWLGGDELDSSNATSNASLSDFPSGTDLAQYHTYGALMTPTTTTWYFDNQVMNTYPTYPVFLTQPMYLMLGDQMGCNGYGSCPGGTPSFLNMSVQWVHVFQ